VRTIAIALMSALTGCAAVDSAVDTVRPARTPEQVAERAQARHEKEMTRRYTICMKQQLGAFGSFASPESRRKAAETCQSVITPKS